MRRTTITMGVCAVCVAILSGPAAGAAEARLDFNEEGVFPHDELNGKYTGSTVDQVRYRGRGDEVNGGLWILNDVAPMTDGYVLYYPKTGGIPELAASDPTTPLSINVRLRLLNDIDSFGLPGGGASGELYFNIRGPGGFLWMYFDYNQAEGRSRIGGRHNNGSIFFREFPEGVSLGDFHVLSVIWDPTVVDSFPAQLYVDGEHIGDTYAGIKAGWSETDGNVEFGDGASIDNKNALVEVDWLRFANDLQVGGAGPEYLPGDANKDGVVNDADLSLLLANWGQDATGDPDGGWSRGEFNDPPTAPVDDSDLSLLLSNWTAAGAVPEPATLTLLALVAVTLRRRR